MAPPVFKTGQAHLACAGWFDSIPSPPTRLGTAWVCPSPPVDSHLVAQGCSERSGFEARRTEGTARADRCRVAR